MTRRALALTDAQLAQLQNAAATLPVEARDPFLHRVAEHLNGIRRSPTNTDVAACIAAVLGETSVTNRMFLCDAQPKELHMTQRKFEIVDKHGNVVDDATVIPDGGKLRVPMIFRDGMSDLQRVLAEDVASRRRSFDDACRHQPGPAYAIDAAALDDRRRAYADSVRDLSEAWRNSSPMPTLSAAAPPLRQDGARPVYDAAEGRRIKQEAYARMCAEDREA